MDNLETEKSFKNKQNRIRIRKNKLENISHNCNKFLIKITTGS